MAVGGTWAARSANARAYTGALRWGTGYNPIHEVRDNPGRVTGIKENLAALGDPSDAPPGGILAGDDFISYDWDGEEPYPDETFRYQESEPRWDQATPQFRDATTSEAMGETPPWGVYNDANQVDGFPLPGPTGGMESWLDVDHGERVERQHAIAAPTRGVAGGWLNKARSTVPQNEAQTVADPTAQWAVATGQVQGPGVKTLDNSRATARGTDSARSSIESRTAGMRAYSPGTSFGMGGGAGTPDMQPFQHTAGLKRPWTFRKPGLPPDEDHFMNTMEGREPIQRTVPPDPYQGDPETAGDTGGTGVLYDFGGPGDGGDVDWGYF